MRKKANLGMSQYQMAVLVVEVLMIISVWIVLAGYGITRQEWLLSVHYLIRIAVDFGAIYIMTHFCLKRQREGFIHPSNILVPVSWLMADGLYWLNTFGWQKPLLPTKIVEFFYLIPGVVILLIGLRYLIKVRQNIYRLQIFFDIVMIMALLTFLINSFFGSDSQIATSAPVMDEPYLMLIRLFIWGNAVGLAIFFSLLMDSFGKLERYRYYHVLAVLALLVYYHVQFFWVINYHFCFLALNQITSLLILNFMGLPMVTLVCLMAFSSRKKSKKHSAEDVDGTSSFDKNVQGSEDESIRIRYVFALMMVGPVILWAYGIIHPLVIIRMTVILGGYFLLNRYFLLAVEDTKSLRRESTIKKQLEMIVNNQTEDLRRTNQDLRQLTCQDFLTKLYNRDYFLKLLDKKVSLRRSRFSIFYIDLNRFKGINDMHGHQVGDQVLINIAGRLKFYTSEHGEQMEVARFSDDEFVLVVETKKDEEVERIGYQLLELIGQTITIDLFRFNVTAAIGIASYPSDSDSVSELLRVSEIAMYEAKKQIGKGTICFYSQNFGHRLERKAFLEKLLKKRNFDEQFVVGYQPRIDYRYKVVTLNAEIKWCGDSRQAITSQELVRTAEEIGIIGDLYFWLIEKISQEIASLKSHYKIVTMVSLKILPAVFYSRQFLPRVQEIINRHGLKPSMFELSFLQEDLIKTNLQMQVFIKELDKKGFRISIANFGAGYSVLSFIYKYPAYCIIISSDLVRKLDVANQEDENYLIMKAIISMAKGMQMAVVAEGADTPEQLEALLKIGCHAIQGKMWKGHLAISDIEKKYINRFYVDQSED